MKLGNLQRGEWIAIAGGLLLALGVFLDWYHLAGNATLHGHHAPESASAWGAHPIMRWLLLAAAAAPLILAWIIAREHELSWPRGQVTMIVAVAAMGLIFYSGIVDRPGDPSGDVSLRLGWYVSLVGSLLMLVGSVVRQSETETARKPPGTI